MLKPTLERWLERTYGALQAEVLETKTRTVGALHRVRMDGEVRWLRVGGVCNRSLAHVEAEGIVLAELHNRGVLVQRPFLRADGRYAGALEIGASHAATIAHEEVDGIGATLEQPEVMRAWGHQLRQLHDTPCDSLGLLPTVEPLVGVLERLELASTWLTPAQREAMTRVIRGALDIITGLTSHTLCHGDVRSSNVRMVAGSATFVDTECLGVGPRMYDLGCAWREHVLAGTARRADDAWQAMKSGYDPEEALSAHEWSAVPALACLRALWTMTLPAEIPQGWGRDWLADPEYWAAHVAQIERLVAHPMPANA